MRDGTTIRYYKSSPPKTGPKPDRVLLFACPNGQCGPAIFYPIIAQYGPRYSYITWDYRGMFRCVSGAVWHSLFNPY